MAKYKQPDTKQIQMVMLDFEELFPPEHPVNKLLGIINRLDLSRFDNNYLNDDKGRPAFPVDRLLSLIIYSILNGNTSMRNLARDVSKRADLIYLSGGLGLEHSTLSVFRKRHSKEIEKLFEQTVFLGVEDEFIDFDTVCIDSTRVKGNANRKDIGTKVDLEKRYEKIQENSKKKYEEWRNATDEDERRALEKSRKRLARSEKRLCEGIKFLEEHENRKRVHLTDKDADFHKDGSKGFLVGYKAHVSVDTKSKMIVHQEVVTKQPDCTQTVDLIEKVEDMKNKCLVRSKEHKIDKEKKTKHVLDAGYASEKNLEKLKGKDVYMPGQSLAHSMNENWSKTDNKKATSDKNKTDNKKAASDKNKTDNAKDKKKNTNHQYTYRDKTETNNAEEKKDTPPSELKFKYNKKKDAFNCPAGRESTYNSRKEFNGISYKMYRINGCAGCNLQSICAKGKSRREIWVKAANLDNIAKEYVIKHSRARDGTKKTKGIPLTLAMSEKLKEPAGRKIYDLRFPIAEGAIGVIKNARQGGKFLRRSLERVQTEWTERCIAYNLGKMIGFARA